MIDFILIVFIGLFAGRGYVRGLVRELLDVVALIVGAILGFRLAGVVGPVVAGISGLSPEVSRIVGGVLAFLAISVAAAVAAHFVNRTITVLPGMTLLNRLAGAGAGVAYGLILATLLLTVVKIAPAPDGVDQHLEESLVAGTLTAPDGPVQTVVGIVAGDRVMQTVIALEELVGKRALAIDDAGGVQLPPVGGGFLRPSSEAAREVYDALNRERVAAGVDPLTWADELAIVAQATADEMYRSGELGAGTGGESLADRLDGAGIPTVAHAQNRALAATAGGVHEAIVGSARQRSNALDATFDRVGVGVVSGPFGLMTVEVFVG